MGTSLQPCAGCRYLRVFTTRSVCTARTLPPQERVNPLTLRVETRYFASPGRGDARGGGGVRS